MRAPRAGPPRCTWPPGGSHRPSATRAPGTAGVSGRDTDIGDYLDAELLDHASPKVRAFLLKTAVLDRMTADLCDAVVDGNGIRPRPP